MIINTNNKVISTTNSSRNRIRTRDFAKNNCISKLSLKLLKYQMKVI